MTTSPPITSSFPFSTISHPCRYWYRQDRRATRRVRRASAAYEAAWKSGKPAMREWDGLHAAHCHAAFVERQLCRARGW